MSGVFLDKIIENYRRYHRKDLRDINLIERAYVFSVTRHARQERDSGEPYIVHPLSVALTVSEIGMDAITISAAFLHDVVEDTGTKIGEIKEKFGEDVAKIVKGLTKLEKKVDMRKEKSIINLFRAFAEDERVMVVKLADRLHNMRTLDGIKSAKKRERIARETLEIFAPFARELFMREISEELYKLSLSVCYKDEYAKILKKLRDIRNERGSLFEKLVVEVERVLRENRISASVKGSYLPIYYIFEEFGPDGNFDNIERLENIFTVDVIVNSIRNCYMALMLLHSKFKYRPMDIVDRLSYMDSDGDYYLGTTLELIHGGKVIRVKVRIRTLNLFRIYKEGVVALYKYGERAFSEKDILWLKRIKENVLRVATSEDLEINEKYEGVKETASAQYIKVISGVDKKEWSVIKGSTVLDYAYMISADLGDHFKIAKINGRTVHRGYVLSEHEEVLIIAGKNEKPNSSWLNCVKTVKAKKAIKKSIRRNILERGRTRLLKVLEKEKISFEKFSDWFLKNKKELSNVFGGIRDIKGLFYYLGIYHYLVEDMVKLYNEMESFDKLRSKVNPEPDKKRSNKIFYKVAKNVLKKPDSFKIDGNFLKYYPYCPFCLPMRGEDSVLISGEDGIEIHSLSCKKLKEIRSFYNKKISWPKSGDDRIYRLKLDIEVEDSIGVLRKIASIISSANGNIVENLNEDLDGNPDLKRVMIIVDIDSFSSYRKLLTQIRKLKFIKKLKVKKLGFA